MVASGSFAWFKRIFDLKGHKMKGLSKLDKKIWKKKNFRKWIDFDEILKKKIFLILKTSWRNKGLGTLQQRIRKETKTVEMTNLEKISVQIVLHRNESKFIHQLNPNFCQRNKKMVLSTVWNSIYSTEKSLILSKLSTYSCGWIKKWICPSLVNIFQNKYQYNLK